MVTSSFAHQMAIKSALPKLRAGMAQSINIGFLGPLTGPVEAWGLPGLNGCRIWEDNVNQAGGLMIGSRRHPIKIHAYDCGYDPKKVEAGVHHLVEKYDIKFLMMLGGDIFTPIKDYLTERKILTSTLLPSDLSPDTPYLIAPSELHPIFNVTGVEWLARNRPELKKVALCSQTDALGLPSLATYRAAFKARGFDLVKEVRYDFEAVEAASIVQPMLDQDPDILCWCTSYTPMVHRLTQYAYEQGFKGQIISCTLDHYEAMINATSKEFMEGFIFQFPDFDDPMLNEKAFFFNQPQIFYEEYNRRFPNSWTAVSWEYAATLDIWHAAVEKAGNVNPLSVLAAMKLLGHVTHAFGPAAWWGEDLFGINNALVGDWPVVVIKDGKARIMEFGSIPDWLDQYGLLLRKEMSALGQLWHQRIQSGGSVVNFNASGNKF